MTQPVNELGLDEVEQQLAELQAKRKELLLARRADDLAKAQKLIEQHGFTAKELGLSVVATASSQRTDDKPKSKLPPKYRNPSNHSETWSGKGRPPEWFAVYVAVDGQTKDQLLIMQP